MIIVNVSPFLTWISPEDSEAGSGYETDSLVPFIAYLGLGLLIALIYASGRAHRGQRRGLTLVSMAVGIAALLQCLAFAIDPMGGLERGDDLSVESGVWVALIGALIWALGSSLLAKEIEGDDHDRTDNHTRDGSAGRWPHALRKPGSSIMMMRPRASSCTAPVRGRLPPTPASSPRPGRRVQHSGELPACDGRRGFGSAPATTGASGDVPPERFGG